CLRCPGLGMWLAVLRLWVAVRVRLRLSLLWLQRHVSGVRTRVRASVCALVDVRGEDARHELLVLLYRSGRLLPLRADMQQIVDAGRSTVVAGRLRRAARRSRCTAMNAMNA